MISIDNDMDGQVLFTPFVLAMLVLLQTQTSKIINMLVNFTHCLGKNEREIVTEISSLKKELRQMSMVSEYVKYVKIEREIIKLEQKLKPFAEERTASQGYAKNAITMTLYILFGLAFAVVMYSCYSTAIIPELKATWFYPLGYFMGLPTGLSTAIGAPFFMLMLRSYVNSIM